MTIFRYQLSKAARDEVEEEELCISQKMYRSISAIRLPKSSIF